MLFVVLFLRERGSTVFFTGIARDGVSRRIPLKRRRITIALSRKGSYKMRLTYLNARMHDGRLSIWDWFLRVRVMRSAEVRLDNLRVHVRRYRTREGF